MPDRKYIEGHETTSWDSCVSETIFMFRAVQSQMSNVVT
jgi:hypothetical protein